MKGRSQEKNSDRRRFSSAPRLRHSRETLRYSFSPASIVCQLPSCVSVSLTLCLLPLVPLLPSLYHHISLISRGGRRSVLRYPAWWRWQATRGEHCNWYVLIMPSDKTWPDHARLNGGQLSRRRTAQSSKVAKIVSGRLQPPCDEEASRARTWESSEPCPISTLFFPFLLFLFYIQHCRLLQTLINLSEDAAVLSFRFVRTERSVCARLQKRMQLSSLTKIIKFHLQV